MLVGPQCGTYFMSPFWCVEFASGSSFFGGKFLQPSFIHVLILVPLVLKSDIFNWKSKRTTTIGVLFENHLRESLASNQTRVLIRNLSFFFLP